MIAEHRIGAIMHFAGSVVVPESVEKPLNYYRNNTVKSRELIESAVKGGVRHFIFSSTAATYGIPDAVPVAEDDPNAADQSLWLVEADDRADAEGRAAGPSAQLWRAALFQRRRRRPAGPLGPVDAGRDPSDQGRGRGGDRQARLMSTVYGTDYRHADGTGVRDYIHVSDLAAAHVAALERLIAAPDESLVINCGYGRGFSVLEVLDASTGSPTCVERGIEARRAGDPPALVADNGGSSRPWTGGRRGRPRPDRRRRAGLGAQAQQFEKRSPATKRRRASKWFRNEGGEPGWAVRPGGFWSGPSC